MYPVQLESIHSDIMVAKLIIYDTTGVGKSPYMINQAAYHSAQAIEKCLKAIIRDGGMMTDVLKKTHNINDLMLRAELCIEGFVHNYSVIAENAEEMLKFNSLRYCENGIDKYDAIAIFKEAKRLYQDVERMYLEKSPSVEEMRNKSIMQYEAMNKLSIARKRNDGLQRD